MKTLEEILKYEQEHRYEGGDFGINACKESIKRSLEYDKKTSLYQLLEGYVDRANKDVFFNKRMILACWEMINGR